MQSIEMETKEGQALKLPQFRWGVRRGVGTKGKNVRFYESFSYNGTDYSRYDCVTVYKKGEQEPYIAKITKIWEDLDDTTKPRKIKLHWFFRPAELYNAAVDFKPIASPNEIFIASGTGKGVANINPIETILKKCIVLCTSKGEQNPQPTQEDLDNADYFYYRTFNVDTYCISERLTELEEDLVFNKKSWVRKGSSFVKHASFMSEERFTNCRSSKRHVLQEHERKNDVEEASKKIIKSETSSRVVKSQPSGGHFDNTIGGTVRRELGSLLVPNIEGQEDESQINVSVRKPTNDYIASENARKELKMDEQSDMMVKKQTTTPYGCVDGVNAEAQSIELQLSCERKKTIVNEMASKPPEKVDDISEDNTIVVTDNGSAYKAAGRLLMHYYPHLYWTPCAAHCIDLLLEDLARLPWIKKVVRRAKFISKFVYTHSHVHHLFRQHSNGKEIIRPGNTRFATNFILLDSMQEVKQALMDMFVNPLWSHDERFAPLRRTTEARRMTKIVYDCVEGAGKFWYEAKNVIQVTQPLVIVLRKVDGERPSLAYVYEAMCRAKEAIRCYLTENGLLDRFSSISTKINERWGNQMHNDLHAAAHILNPQFGFGRDFDIADEDVRLKVQLENVLDRLVLDPVKRGQVAKELDMYRKKMGMNFRRPVAEIMKSDMKPEDWWTNYGLDTLALKEIAIRIVSQPCSASGCERNWSVFEHIHSRKRNRLTTERLNDLVFVHHNLRFDLKELASTSSEVLDLDDIHPSLPCTQWIGEGDEHDDTSQDDAIPCHTRVCTPTVVTGHADVGDHSDDDSRDQIHDENIASNASSDSESSDEEEPLFSAEELGMPPVEGDPVPAEFSRHSSVYRPRRKLPIHRNAGEGSSQNP